MALYNDIWDWNIGKPVVPSLSQTGTGLVPMNQNNFSAISPGAFAPAAIPSLTPNAGLSINKKSVHDSWMPSSNYEPVIPRVAPELNTGIAGLKTKGNPDTEYVVPGKSIYDKMAGYSKGLAAFELGMSGISALQALLAKPTTVTRPQNVNLQAPKIESEVEASRALIKENLGTGINTWLESTRERGYDPQRAGVGIFAEANRLMRQSSAELSMRNQDILNRGAELTAQIENQEAGMNAEITNRYIERRDQILAADSERRGMQLSQAVSNVGQIASRTMNDYLMIETLRKENEADNMMYEIMRLQALGLGIQ